MEPCDYNHLILYAKGWYEQGDRVEDVRRILAIRAMPHPKPEDADVWLCVVNALEKYCPEKMARIMTELFKPIPKLGKPFRFNSSPCSLNRALYYALTELAHLTVNDDEGNATLELGGPDEDILPFSNLYQELILKGLAQ